MSIQRELDQIKNAVYGKEVRGAIHDGIKKTYDDASRNGNANMEVEMARGVYDSLSQRFISTEQRLAEKASKEYVDQHLSAISDGTPLFAKSVAEMTELNRIYFNTTDGFLYVYDGNSFKSTGVRYLSNSIEDYMVEENKLWGVL